MQVLDLDIFVPHERPGGEVRLVELRRATEVLNRAFWFAAQRIVVAHETAYLRSVLVDGEKIVRKFRELKAVFGHIKDV